MKSVTSVWGWAQRSKTWLGSLPPLSPVPLALLRVTVGVLILLSPEPNQTRALMAMPSALWIAPSGLGFLPPLLWELRPCLPYVHVAFYVTTLATILGVFTRWSLGLTALGFVVMFGGAQLSGTVTHDMHLLWFLLVLLFSDSHRALSVDAWRRKAPLWFVAASRASTLSLVVVRTLLGCVYLFPGLSKLRVSGTQWALSDNLINQMHLKWFINGGKVPWPRVDHVPSLVALGGVLVLVFEIGFITAIWTRRGRLVAGLAGLAFHFTTAHFFYIHFASLWGCYVILWDGPKRRVATEATERSKLTLQNEWRTLALGVALVVAIAVPGVRRQTQAWPFACYPDFAHLVGAHATDLAVDVAWSDGSVETLRPSRSRPNHEWGTVWRILGLYDGRPHFSGLESYGRVLIARSATPQIRGVIRMSFFAEEYTTDPDQNTLQPFRRRLIHARNNSQ